MHVSVRKAFDRIEAAQRKLREAQSRLENLKTHQGLSPIERFVVSNFDAHTNREKYELRLKAFEDLDERLRSSRGEEIAIVCEAVRVIEHARGGTPGTHGRYNVRLDVYNGTLSGKGLEFGTAERLFGNKFVKEIFGDVVPAVIFPTGDVHTYSLREGQTSRPGEFHVSGRRQPNSKVEKGPPKVGIPYLPHLSDSPKEMQSFLWPYASQILFGKEAKDYIDDLMKPPLV